jgi:hypothetical protein
MERLIKPAIDGGVPYINQDFFNVLQESNLRSYKSFMENINDTNEIGSNGIIVKGVRNVTPVGQTLLIYDFTNSMIYLDGDFLEPKPSIAQEDNKQILASKFYLIKYTEDETREKKVSGFTDPVLIKTYFDVSTDLPPSGESYIEIEVKSGKEYCSRYLSRLMRYNLAEFGQVQMTLKKDFFDQTGKGFGEMFGFAICNGNNGTQNLESRFLISYATSSNSTLYDINTTTPTTPTTTLTNYNRLGNIGGLANVSITVGNLPSHNHGGLTDQSNNNMRHGHEIQYGNWQNSQPTVSGKYFARSRKIASGVDSIGGQNKSYKTFRTQTRDDSLPMTNYKALRNSQTGLWEHDFPGHLSGSSPIDLTPNLGDHNHAISSSIDPSLIPHNNEPAFVYVIYYEKINPYV